MKMTILKTKHLKQDNSNRKKKQKNTKLKMEIWKKDSVAQGKSEKGISKLEEIEKEHIRKRKVLEL